MVDEYGLTPKQRAFADYYIKTANIREAAEMAGYSKKTAQAIGNENLSKPLIKQYIDERMGKMNKDRIASAEEVLQILTDIARGEATGITLRGVGMGEQTVEKVTPTVSERKSAADSLAKRYSLFTERHQVNHSGGVQIIDDVEDDE